MATIDYRELTRFIFSGGVATVGNLSAVWIARGHMTYRLALLSGVAAGMIISLAMAKLFAFRARNLVGVASETARFLLVYGVGVAVYWTAALLLRGFARQHDIPSAMADMGSAFCGAGLMAFTGYFGHRFFTFRTHR